MRISLIFALILTSNVWSQYTRNDYQTALKRKSELLQEHLSILNEADSALINLNYQTGIFYANFRLSKHYQEQLESYSSKLGLHTNILTQLHDTIIKEAYGMAIIGNLQATKFKTADQLRSYNRFELEDNIWLFNRPMDSSLYMEDKSRQEKTAYLIHFNSLLETVKVSNRRTCDSVVTSLTELKNFNDSISQTIALQEACLLKSYNYVCQVEKRILSLQESYIRKEISNNELSRFFYNVNFNKNYRDTTLSKPCDSTAIFPPENYYDPKQLAANKLFYHSLIGDFICKFPEIPAAFQGGKEALDAYIQQHLNRSANYTSGKVYVQFIVSKKGQISNVSVVRYMEDCDACNKEALRLVKAMPKWIPATNKGKKVNSTFYLGIPFS